ncbi:unnamed protein product [Notodromas monacha]|uniref:Peroxidase n=1 Tax=Notodromas monacha TaxID=399045 RepID=A0A7R9GDJ5_9CRUS|nr:unnamed protein product [Notodromas monacha]CAG0916970.1 unnamed protein product [Notodromas monacha]
MGRTSDDFPPLPLRKRSLLPPLEEQTSECRQLDPAKHCFFAGDSSRVQELFNLKLQRNGYYEGYNISINPTVANAFGTAAFRFGHSLVQPKLKRCDKFHRIVPFDVELHREMMDPAPLHGTGAVDRLALGLAAQEAQNRDEFVTDQLTNHLFQAPDGDFGMDLVSINIQRGRDHGLPPYNIWRERCSLKKVRNFSDLLDVMHDDTVGRLRMAYSDVQDIDLFTGGLSERPIVGGLVGPTFACILAQQFMNLRRGDRFWYENGGFRSSFTQAQLSQIRRSSLSRVMCDNLDDIDTIQLRIMEMANVEGNARHPCRSPNIPSMDFIPWREISRPTFFSPSENDSPGSTQSLNTNELRAEDEFFRAFERKSEVNPTSTYDSILPQPFGLNSYEDEIESRTHENDDEPSVIREKESAVRNILTDHSRVDKFIREARDSSKRLAKDQNKFVFSFDEQTHERRSG